MKVLKTTSFRSVGRDLRDTDDMVRAEIDFTVLEYRNFQKLFGKEIHSRLEIIEEESLRNMSKKAAKILSRIKDVK
jgi:hypothetical protein